jgi:hypothetical protein
MIKFSPPSPNERQLRQSPAQSTITTSITAYQVSVVVSCLGRHSTDDYGRPFNHVVEWMCAEQQIEHVVFCPSFRSAKNLCRSKIVPIC